MPDGLNYQGRAVVNVKGMQKPALFIAGHEISHTWQNLAERGATKARLGQAMTQDEADAQRIWAPVESAIWDMIPDSSRKAYAYAALSDEIKGQDGKPRKWTDLQADPKFMRTLRREMAADFHGKRLSDPETVNELARRAPEHFGDYAKKVVGWINASIAKLRGSKGGKLGANDVDQHIKDLTKAKLIWTDAMISWRKRGGANASPVAQAAEQPSTSARSGFLTEKDPSKIVNSVDLQASPEEKVRQLVRMTGENRPLVKSLMAAIDARLGSSSKDNIKKPENILSKASRPSLLEKKPWHGVEHIRDSYRFKTDISSVTDLPAVVEELDRAGVEVIKYDVDKVLSPGDWGWRIAAFDLRMPNGQLVEYYLPVRELEAAKAEGHKIFEEFRNEPVEALEGEKRGAYQAALQRSRDLYQGAWDAYLARSGDTEEAIRASLSKVSAMAGEAPSKPASINSPSVTLPEAGDQEPSASRRAVKPSAVTNAAFEPSESTQAKAGISNPPSDTSSDGSIVNQRQQSSQPEKQFDIKTLKEGSLKVLGDVEAIRAALPDDVKGRKIPGGMLFSPSAAPRAKAALEGRKLAYSRAGQVTDKLPMKDGRYVGAPERFNTPQKIPQLRKLLRQLTDEGAPGRFWYENSSKEVLQMVGGDVKEARKFVAILAIYSPQAKVDANSTFALRAWAQYKAGQPISVKTKVMDDKATAAMSDIDAFWSGEKTGNFFNNLLREIDPTVADKQGATIDMWMMRAAQYESDAPTDTQYAFMENENNRIAKELGWEPQQVQAAIWVAMKARFENKGVKGLAEESSEKRGWIRWAESLKGKPVRVILNAQKHRDNWLAKAMAHDVTKSDTQAAKFDFSDGVRRHIGQISWEARPGRTTGVLPGVNDAPYEQQVEFQQAVQKALYSEEGADLLAQQLGLLVDGPDTLAPGVWQGEVAAGMQKQVAMAPGKGDDGKTVDPAQKKALDLYAATLGLLLRQESVGWHRPFYKGLKSAENGVELRIGRPLTQEEAQALWGAVDERMRAAGVANWEQKSGMISSPSGMRLVNFGAVDNNAKFRNLVLDAAATLAVDEVDPHAFSSDGNLVSNNWKEASRGQGFADQVRQAGRPDLLGWTRDVLAPRVQSVFDEFSGKYGWGDPGRVEDLFDGPSRSARSDAAGGGRNRDLAEGQLRGRQTYGVETPGAAAPLEAIHFSREQRSALSAGAYGTGLKGAEAARLQGADARLRQRIYFYFNQGTGIRPEAGVGPHAHRVTLNNLADGADPALRKPGMTANEFESAVLDAGYDGYLVRLPGQQSGQAVLLGAHNIPVEYLGMGAPQKTQPAPASQAAAASSTRSGDDLVSRAAPDVAAIRGQADIKAVAPSFRFEFGKARVKASEAELANAALEQLGSELSFSRRGTLVSPQSTLDAAIEESTRVLENAIQRGGQMAGLGQTSHVLGMLKGVAVPLTMDGSVVRKVFIEKHAGKLDGIPAGDIVRGLYRPAMVFQQKAKPNEFELVLPVVTPQGPLTAAILVDGDRAAVKSIYPRSWQNAESGPALRRWMANQADSKPVYLDEYLSLIAVTGNEDARAEAGIREKAGSPGDQRPGVKTAVASAAALSPAQTPAGSGPKSVSLPGAPVNRDHFIAWKDFRALAMKFGKLKGEQDLLRWIGDNYKGDLADAPSFSSRQIETPEFKRWFGADSTMVNEDGSPMILWHGTTKANAANIGVFRRSKTGAMGPAIYLGDSREASEGYNQGGMMQVYARGKYLSNAKWTDYVNRHGWSGAEAAAKADGWSGVHDSRFESAVAVWDPRDIKSATRNSGSFDPNDSDISRSARQIETPEFKRWFGNSKVVDADGKPLVVYHGTTADFSEFDPDLAGQTFGDPDEVGMLFSSRTGEPDLMAKRGGGNVMPVYLSLQDPLVVEVPSARAKAMFGSVSATTWYDNNKAEIVAQARKGGHDGIIINSVASDGYQHATYVALRPEQIKSAIGNSGAFDPDDADISRSARQPTLWRDELGRLRSPTGKLAAYYGGILNTWLAKAPFGGLNYMSPELKRQFREMKIQLQKAQDVTIAVARESFKMSEAERELVSDIIEGQLKTGIVPPSHAVQMAMGMQAVLGQQTDELVALGMLSKESADLWRGKYLPRFYRPKLKDQLTEWGKALQQLIGRKPIMAGIQGKRLKSRGLWETVTHKGLPKWEALGWQVRDPDYDPSAATARTEVQIWRDFTPEEREKMGEIRDAGFRFAMGYQQAQRDIAYGKLFKGIADTMSTKNERPGYVQVPDSTVEGTGVKRYGALAGRWVPLEVLQHLKAMDSGSSEAMQMYRKAMSLWKEGKVVLNPVSHANNVLSNISMAHFAGVSFWDQHKYAMAAKDLATRGGYYQEAKDAGLMLGTMGQEELMNMLPPELQALVHQQRSTGGRIVEGAFNALTFSWTRNGEQKGLRKHMAKAYEAEDIFFRYMIYADARKRGLTQSEAVDHSQRYIFTYDDLPIGAQKIRDFGMPFFAYTYKAIPALLHTAANYPHRMLAPAAMLYALNAAMYALAAGDDDEDWLEKLKKGATDEERQAKMKALEAEERENLPPWMKGYVTIGAKKAIRLGTDEVLGLPVFWDVGQIMPGGNMFDMHNNTGGVGLPQSLTVSHPLFTTLGAMLLNRDSFFGKDIVDKTDDSGEAALKRTEWLWRQYAPAISFGNYHWERALNILAQQTGEPVTYWPWRDLTGVDKAGMPIEPGYTALQTVGIKVRPVDTDRSAEMRDGQNRALMRDIDKELRNFRRMNQAGYMSDANLERELERAALKKERLRDGLTVDGDPR